MMFIWFGVLLLSIVVQSSDVTIPDLGTVRGTIGETAWTKRTIQKFYSIKYGKSPTGNLRFSPPVSVESWNGIYDATVPKIPCPQSDILNIYEKDPIDIDLEDCLSLNVFSPKIQSGANDSSLIPVMVFIHGGGLTKGSAQYFPPDYLLEHDIVLVVPQYRLTVFGFMSMETEEMPGNVALLDQVLALEWVNKNIKYFGGDNTRVTIFGQSAGSFSVALHMFSSMVESRLFQRAIMHSGTSFVDWAYDENVTKTTLAIYQSLIGNNSYSVDLNKVQSELKQVSVIDLLKTVERAMIEHPWIERKLRRITLQKKTKVRYLSDYTKKLAETGSYKAIPMMIGMTKNDGSFLVAEIYDQLEKQGVLNDYKTLRRELKRFYTNNPNEDEATVNLLEDIYFKNVFNDDKNSTFADIAPGLIDLKSFYVFKSPTLKHAKLNAKFGSDTFLYSFNYKGEHTRFGYGQNVSKYPFDGGVHHSDDLLYLFPFHYKTSLNEQDTKMAKIMTDLWANFATDGKPVSSLLNIDWPSVKPKSEGPFLNINLNPTIDYDFLDIKC